MWMMQCQQNRTTFPHWKRAKNSIKGFSLPLTGFGKGLVKHWSSAQGSDEPQASHQWVAPLPNGSTSSQKIGLGHIKCIRRRVRPITFKGCCFGGFFWRGVSLRNKKRALFQIDVKQIPSVCTDFPLVMSGYRSAVCLLSTVRWSVQTP